MQCVRQISSCQHPKDLSKFHFSDTPAEYAGTVNHETLKKLGEGCWIDSTITNAVIGYIKDVEGANDHHHDDRRETFVFSHT